MMADHVDHLKTYSKCRIEGGHRFLNITATRARRHDELLFPSVKNIVSQQ
ncbi:hypothetical protein ACLK17_10430 [Escherichia coli]